MSTFNHNMRFFAEKEDLSQQKMADVLGIKRGRIAGLFYNTQPKEDIQLLLVEKFNIDRGKFLSIAMTNDNYQSFFTTKEQDNVGASGIPATGYMKADFYELIQRLKSSDSPEERTELADKAMSIYLEMLRKNSLLLEEIKILQSDMLELVNKG